MASSLSRIRTEVVFQCPLCRSEDKETLYGNLKDYLHGTPGEWTYKRCRNCGLIFLDPRPVQEDIDKAYDCPTYGTHQHDRPRSALRRLRAYLGKGYLANKYGYDEGVGRFQRMAGWLIYLHPGQREVLNCSIMYLPVERRGRVLDVGCGSGDILNELRRLRWRVEGVDPDPQAVRLAARNYGLDVEVGTVETRDYPPDHFDAVIASHVIEHVYDPVSFLKECWRVLRPGGILVIATPNADSLGHLLFGPDWRVLEPPRHLTVFSSGTLSRAASQAGITSPELRSHARGANGIFYLSRRLRAASSLPEEGRTPVSTAPISGLEQLGGQVYQYVVSIALRVRPEAGEELLMVAVK